jgi:hypothetical protein
MEKDRETFLYRVWNNETDKWESNRGKSTWLREGDAKRLLRWMDDGEVVKFELVIVESEI